MKISFFYKASLHFLLVILLSGLASCAKENYSSFALSEEINNAKNWFEENKQSVEQQSLKRFKGITPFWDKATQLGDNIEVPFSIDGKVFVPRGETGLNSRGRQRLILLKIENGYFPYLVTIIPSSKFKGNIGEIGGFNFKEKKFDGDLLIQPLFSDLGQMFQIKDGKTQSLVTGKFQSRKEVISQLEKSSCSYYQVVVDTFTWGHVPGEPLCLVAFSFEYYDFEICTNEQNPYDLDPQLPDMHFNCSGYSIGGGSYGDQTLCPDPCLPWCK